MALFLGVETICLVDLLHQEDLQYLCSRVASTLAKLHVVLLAGNQVAFELNNHST